MPCEECGIVPRSRFGSGGHQCGAMLSQAQARVRANPAVGKLRPVRGRVRMVVAAMPFDEVRAQQGRRRQVIRAATLRQHVPGDRQLRGCGMHALGRPIQALPDLIDLRKIPPAAQATLDGGTRLPAQALVGIQFLERTVRREMLPPWPLRK